MATNNLTNNNTEKLPSRPHQLKETTLKTSLEISSVVVTPDSVSKNINFLNTGLYMPTNRGCFPKYQDIVFLNTLLGAARYLQSSAFNMRSKDLIAACGLSKAGTCWKVITKSLDNWGNHHIQIKDFYRDGKKFDYESEVFADVPKYTKGIVTIHFDQVFWDANHSGFCKVIPLTYYRNLKPVAMRLYEILCSKFLGGNAWVISVLKLAEKIPVSAKNVADVMYKLLPHLQQINHVTDLSISWETDGRGKNKMITFLKGKNNDGNTENITTTTVPTVEPKISSPTGHGQPARYAGPAGSAGASVHDCGEKHAVPNRKNAGDGVVVDQATAPATLPTLEETLGQKAPVVPSWQNPAKKFEDHMNKPKLPPKLLKSYQQKVKVMSRIDNLRPEHQKLLDEARAKLAQYDVPAEDNTASLVDVVLNTTPMIKEEPEFQQVDIAAYLNNFADFLRYYQSKKVGQQYTDEDINWAIATISSNTSGEKANIEWEKIKIALSTAMKRKLFEMGIIEVKKALPAWLVTVCRYPASAGKLFATVQSQIDFELQQQRYEQEKEEHEKRITKQDQDRNTMKENEQLLMDALASDGVHDYRKMWSKAKEEVGMDEPIGNMIHPHVRAYWALVRARFMPKVFDLLEFEGKISPAAYSRVCQYLQEKNLID